MSSCPSIDNAAPRKISPRSTRGKKRHARGSNNQRRNSNESGGGELNKRQKLEPMDLDPIFPKLNQSDPVHARRIQQRRKNIAMGKNTAGYFEYTKKVPKHKRKPRSMVTPETPDHTLDIPAKRWQGMVKAWRRALHQYDPPELVTNGNSNSSNASQPSKSSGASKDKTTSNVQARQIEEAISKGLLVDVSTPVKTPADVNDIDSPFSVLSEGSSGRRNIMDMDRMGCAEGDDFAGDDSDDDLL